MAKDKTNNTFFGSFSQVDEVEDDKELDKDLDKTSEESDEDEDLANEEDEDQDTDTLDTNTDGDKDVDDDEFFTTIINDQAEKGVLFYDPEKEYEGSGEEIFDEVIEDTLAKKWETEYVAAIPEEYHSLFEALKSGKSVTEWYENTQPTDYSKVDTSDEATQKELIKQHLTSTGMDEDDISDTIQEYEDAGTLEKNSKKSLKYLEKAEKGKAEKYEKALEAERAEQVEAQEKEFERFKSEVLAVEEIGKRKVDKKTKERLLDHITKPVNKKGESQYAINQKSRDKQLQLAYLDMIGFDFSQLEKEAETKAASGLRAKLSKTTDPNARGSGSRKQESIESKKIGGWQPF